MQPAPPPPPPSASSSDVAPAALVGFTVGIIIGAASNDYDYGPYAWRGGARAYHFPNARYIEDLVNAAAAANPAACHVILECPAVNTIDYSALESLEAINHRLKDM